MVASVSMLDLDMMVKGVQLIIIITSQVWNWFQNRRYAIRAKTSKAPGKLAVSPVVQIESTPVRNVPQTVVVPAPTPVGIKKNCYVILVFKHFNFITLFFSFLLHVYYQLIITNLFQYQNGIRQNLSLGLYHHFKTFPRQHWEKTICGGVEALMAPNLHFDFYISMK